MKYDEDNLTQTDCRVNEVIDWNSICMCVFVECGEGGVKKVQAKLGGISECCHMHNHSQTELCVVSF